jgi:hypothetical protein
MTSEWPINCDNRINRRFESSHQKRGEYAKIAALTQPAFGSYTPIQGHLSVFMTNGDAHADHAGHHHRHY